MIPDDIESHNNLIPDTRICQDASINEITKNQRWLAKEAFSKYISQAPNLTAEEIKQLMIKAYQGCDLKYSKDYITDVPITGTTRNSECQ